MKEEQKKVYFDNLKVSIIIYDNFLELQVSLNLKLLIKFTEQRLIYESFYFNKNNEILKDIKYKIDNL